MKRTPIQRRTPLRPKAPLRCKAIQPRAWKRKDGHTTVRLQAPPPRPAKTLETYTPKPRAAAVAVADTRARMVVSIPKAEKAKPGKRTPTAEEREWMDFITATTGCIACLIDGHPETPGAVHHLLRGGRRIGHMHSICLCDPGHHQNGQQRGMVSRHPHKARFEARYGTEAELLDKSRALWAQARGLSPKQEISDNRQTQPRD